MTKTAATLQISAAAFDEIAEKLREAGYPVGEGIADMEGIVLARAAAPEPAEPRQRNANPGAIYEALRSVFPDLPKHGVTACRITLTSKKADILIRQFPSVESFPKEGERPVMRRFKVTEASPDAA